MFGHTCLNIFADFRNLYWILGTWRWWNSIANSLDFKFYQKAAPGKLRMISKKKVLCWVLGWAIFHELFVISDRTSLRCKGFWSGLAHAGLGPFVQFMLRLSRVVSQNIISFCFSTLTFPGIFLMGMFECSVFVLVCLMIVAFFSDQILI